jgi:hypothetical protein
MGPNLTLALVHEGRWRESIEAGDLAHARVCTQTRAPTVAGQRRTWTGFPRAPCASGQQGTSIEPIQFTLQFTSSSIAYLRSQVKGLSFGDYP